MTPVAEQTFRSYREAVEAMTPEMVGRYKIRAGGGFLNGSSRCFYFKPLTQGQIENLAKLREENA